jgi:hypothetical protein
MLTITYSGFGNDSITGLRVQGMLFSHVENTRENFNIFCIVHTYIVDFTLTGIILKMNCACIRKLMIKYIQ